MVARWSASRAGGLSLLLVTVNGKVRALGTSPGNYCIDQLAADSKPPLARRDPHGHQMCPA